MDGKGGGGGGGGEGVVSVRRRCPVAFVTVYIDPDYDQMCKQMVLIFFHASAM